MGSPKFDSINRRLTGCEVRESNRVRPQKRGKYNAFAARQIRNVWLVTKSEKARIDRLGYLVVGINVGCWFLGSLEREPRSTTPWPTSRPE